MDLNIFYLCSNKMFEIEAAVGGIPTICNEDLIQVLMKNTCGKYIHDQPVCRVKHCNSSLVFMRRCETISVTSADLLNFLEVSFLSQTNLFV